MTEMGRYCKAYPVKRFREYAGWTEDAAELRETPSGEKRESIEDDDVFYLQDNYVVTDGIIKDENVVFAGVTESWKRFCKDVLKFRVPDSGESP